MDQKFIVYKSSAGSGKTYTLVREYLVIVLGNPEQFRQVLAITFTNKAANEMKERVVGNLAILAEPDKNRDSATIRYLLPELAGRLRLNEAQVSARAYTVLRLIMHHYAEFAISTIDSFTHRVIRTFAHDLKIPLNFEVELDSDALLSQSVDLLISLVGSDEQITKVLVDFVENRATDEASWMIERDLKDFGKTLLHESSIPALEELGKYEIESFMKVRTSLISWKFSWEGALRKAAEGIMALFAKEGLTQDAFVQRSKGIYLYILNMAKGRTDKIKPGSAAQTALSTEEWINKNASPGEKAAFDRISAQVLHNAGIIREMVERDYERFALCKLILKNIFSTALLGEIEKTLASLCLENNKLLIGEFNRLISGVIREQPAPFIYERLGEKYHNFLIDEFQDTSILQWHNLLPLVENSLASNRMSLVVGDAKQAIYRFRSGDALQFEILPKLLREFPDPLLNSREQTLVRHYHEENLGKNHRSSPVIVDFNNKFFSFMSGSLPEPYGNSFRKSAQETAKPDKKGMVRLEKLDTDDGTGLKYAEKTQNHILSLIRQLQEDNFAFRDIAILCRDNNKASGIAAFLVGQGVPVISSESLLLSNSESVNFLVAWIKHLVDPSDAISMAHIIRFVISRNRMPDSGLEDFFGPGRKPDRESFYVALQKDFPFLDYHRLKSIELFGLVSYLVHHFSLNETDHIYIRFFQDKVLEFSNQRKGGLPDFLEWWEEKCKNASVIIPEGLNAVRIMTIHKAKGLQFPVVIFPFADEEARVTRKNLWVPLDEQLAAPLKIAYLPATKALTETAYGRYYEDEMNRSVVDMANILYVALTRPEERLYVLLKDFPEKSDDPASLPKWFSRFLASENLLSGDKTFYEFGQRWARDNVLANDVPSGNNDMYLTSRPGLDMLLRRHAPRVWDVEDPDRNREWGNLVHTVMEHIVDAGDVKSILDDLLIEGLLSPEQKEELAVLLRKIMNSPEISGFFDPSWSVRNEPEIITADGTLYRPDRVIVKEKRAIVIDYKTGAVKDDHVSQVSKYAELLSELGYSVEAACLIYLNRQPEVRRVI